ncbi:bifunctional [glutamate--ammonia ligase]-adenylyl-L-tyrosine phosphorylase/[glutamate--ammonia-ligase] adenylyltransferase [Solimicrobium silvestre]|uniref:Bifunctional glutamine synthetase adenylyltransferase/adenylyl-removing enzyme n=1 Tax=Solimicrobium silvestre TaxID=2099400 RepID=A0A2S9H4Q0_9BURK|nr:bifunctional [glutamate--ammonia ligase]-adenylyl-L-tyrosine phosphorylase/[glutamate--ammonia-ligase] adenylyltransferase [Solimicrobium silvestre]PRC94856.1 Glutamine synthetase adenylyltransferase [Solimicrobium silvestre]
MNSTSRYAQLNRLNTSRFFSRWAQAGANADANSNTAHNSPTRTEQINELAELSLTPATFAHFLQKETNLPRQANNPNGLSLPHALRRLRNLVVCTLIEKDLTGKADLNEVVTVMSSFADFAVQTALAALTLEMQAQYGIPVAEDSGEIQELIVLGMGKLGGAELNISSDIDLIFTYAEDGETKAAAGQKNLSNHEFFSRLGKKLIAALSEIGEDGFTFRVDMALRPNGASGPLVASFGMLEEYLLVQGREWERYAWVKARAITGFPSQIAALKKIVQPFVYRRYLDFAVIDALRAMHSQIRAEVIRHETRHPDRANNVKLGRGGIREIEFLTQVFQLIRGGREPLLRNRSTRETLAILANLSIIDPKIVAQLLASYTFLRNLEHRLQYLDDAQTHSMPANPADGEIIAQMMGYTDLAELSVELAKHRAFVAHQFDIIFGATESKAGSKDPEAPNFSMSLADSDNQEVLLHLLSKLAFQNPADGAEIITRSLQAPRLRSISEASKNKCMMLLNRAVVMIAALPDQHAETLQRLLNLLEAIVRRTAYLSLLIEYPHSLERLIRMMHSSDWAARYLIRHPILLDELLDIATLHQAPDWVAFAAELNQQLNLHADDTERQLETLREMHHSQLFRLLAQDLEGMLTVEHLADQLSQLADIMVAATIKAVWRTVTQRHRETPLFSVVAYGKLGGKELGYASDLDVVFIYDDQDQEAPAQYAKLVQRFITWMTSHTPAGVLFDIDIALRPDGASGLMVSSIQAFERYQTQSAWAWEHQALTRARCCTGPVELVEKFDALRQQILCQAREPETLKQEVLTMRNKMREANPVQPDKFDLKHSPGGMIDIEFMVQYLVLRYAHNYPQLCANYGNIALLITCGELGLIQPEHARPVADIYRHWRKQQHMIRLQGIDQAKIDSEIAAEEAQQVVALWEYLFA